MGKLKGRRESCRQYKKLPSLAEDSTWWKITCCSWAVAISCTQIYQRTCGGCGDLMVSRLDSRSSGPGFSLGRFTGLCSWTRHVTLTVLLSNLVCKWVLLHVTPGGNAAMDWHPIQEGVEILLVNRATETGISSGLEVPLAWCRLNYACKYMYTIN